MRFSTRELAAHLGGELVGPDVGVDGASIDSRTIRPGQLYVPDRGRRATATPSSRRRSRRARRPTSPRGSRSAGRPSACRDTAAALLSLGGVRPRSGRRRHRHHRVGRQDHHQGPPRRLPGVDVPHRRERALLQQRAGPPADAAERAGRARWVVLEMGARRVGDIERLAAVARPDVGIVTSVAHGARGVLRRPRRRGPRQGRARGRVAGIGPRGPELRRPPGPRHGVAQRRVPCSGTRWSADAEVRAEDVTLDRDLRARFRLSSPWGQAEVRLALHGAHQVPNALAAATAALWCGVPHRGRGRGAGGAPGLAAGAWRSITCPAAPSWSSTASTRSPRRPRRPCARWPRCRASASWRSSG